MNLKVQAAGFKKNAVQELNLKISFVGGA